MTRVSRALNASWLVSVEKCHLEFMLHILQHRLNCTSKTASSKIKNFNIQERKTQNHCKQLRNNKRTVQSIDKVKFESISSSYSSGYLFNCRSANANWKYHMISCLFLRKLWRKSWTLKGYVKLFDHDKVPCLSEWLKMYAFEFNLNSLVCGCDWFSDSMQWQFVFLGKIWHQTNGHVNWMRC